MTTDILQRMIDDDNLLRIYTAVTTNLAHTITEQHNATPNAAAALTDTLTAGALLSAMLKPESSQSLDIKFQGEGPLRIVHVQANAHGQLRGYVAAPHVDYDAGLDTIDFSKAIGAGILTVTRDYNMKEPWSGTIALAFGSVARDTALYLLESEQVPSAILLARNFTETGAMGQAAGILIQSLPDTPDTTLAHLEQLIEKAPSLAHHIGTGAALEDYLTNYLNITPRLLSQLPLMFNCTCSRESIAGILTSFKTEELEEMLNVDKGAHIACTFCGSGYDIDEKKLETILSEKKAAD